MTVCVDTNVLVRAATGDDVNQSPAARRLLGSSEKIAISMSSLCEFAWVLRSGYRFSDVELAASLRALLLSDNVDVDRGCVEAGMETLLAGGDFADGVIAYEGRSQGAAVFLSFDKKAVSLLQRNGHRSELVS